MLSRRTALIALTALGAVALGARADAQPLTELNFGIISTESQQNLRPLWTPFLADMEKAMAMPVRAFFAPDYAGIIEGMRFNKVQLAWYGNASAIQAVDRAGGEVFAQTVPHTGEAGYYSLILVHKDSPIRSLDDIVRSPGKLTFANGDPNSTSGFLIPGYYAWAQNNVDIRTHFARMVAGNHEANALAVANKQVDVATGNTENMERLSKTAADKFALIREVWRSPLIPSDPIVWRKDLSPEMRTRIKTFFITYGVATPGKAEAQLAHEKAVLTALQWAPFRESSDRQLVPIRETSLFRDKLRVQQDDKLSAAEKEARIREIDSKLAELKKMIGS